MAYITTISNTTSQKRQQIKRLQDEFTTFSWGGVDAFENFGAFIINEKKGSLKFYNGPSFSNEYTKPQFDNAGGNLEGITFNKQTISFKIGVYWISIEDYRKFLNWLDPVKIDYLQFGFSPNFRYDVKLSKVGDSTRWIVGRENGEPRYYTEMDLSFDVQGTPCAKGMSSYEFVGNTSTNSRYWNFNRDDETKLVTGNCILYKNNDFIPSDLQTPVQVHFDLKLFNDNVEGNYIINNNELVLLSKYNTSDSTQILLEENAYLNETELLIDSIIDTSPAEYEIKLYAKHTSQYTPVGGEKILLCDVILQHFANFVKGGYELNFTYVGETGLVFMQSNNSGVGSLLTLQTFTDTGNFLVKSLQSHKFMLPGEFQYNGFYDSENTTEFILEYSKRIFNGTNWVSKEINSTAYSNQPIVIECFPRTNII